MITLVLRTVCIKTPRTEDRISKGRRAFNALTGIGIHKRGVNMSTCSIILVYLSTHIYVWERTLGFEWQGDRGTQKIPAVYREALPTLPQKVTELQRIHPFRVDESGQCR